MPSSKKSASRYMELAESRRRFAQAASSAEQQGSNSTPQQQAKTDTTQQQAQESRIVTHTSPSDLSSLPPNSTLSAPAVELLEDHYSFAMKSKKPPTTPLSLAKMIVGLDVVSNMVMDDVRGKKLPPGVKVPYWKLDLIQALLELEDVPLDSLSPQLQQIKLGFEQIPLDPSMPKGIERRANEALRAGGEATRIKLLFSDWRIDRSTVPPTRVLKTDKQRVEPLLEREAYLKSLRKRKPRIYATVEAIIAEQAAHMPTDNLPPPDKLGRRTMGQRSQASTRLEQLGYLYSDLCE